MHLQGVLLDGRTMVATDGLTLVRVVFGARGEHLVAPVTIPTGACKQALKLISKSSQFVTISRDSITVDGASVPYTSIDAAFPPYGSIIPDVGAYLNDVEAAIGMDPVYLQRIAKAAKDFSVRCAGRAPLRMSCGGPLHPIRFDRHCAEGDLTMVLMPVRL